jgi:hypothetical protein
MKLCSLGKKSGLGFLICEVAGMALFLMFDGGIMGSNGCKGSAMKLNDQNQ